MNKLPRNIHEARTLKEALHDTIHRHPTLSVEAIAEELNMTASYLNRAALPDKDTEGDQASGVRFPLKQLVPLIRATGDYSTLDFIERKLGRVAFELPKDITASTLPMDSIKAAAEFGELMGAIEQSVKDGQLSRAEKERIEKEGWEAVRAIIRILVACSE